MSFNSTTFGVFFAVVFAIYWALRIPRRQNLFLVAASLLFYGWWDYRFVTLLVISVVTDYVCAIKVDEARGRKGTGRAWLNLSLLVNLGLLGFFKYFDFFIESARPLWEALGWNPGLLHVILPVGISFYTFQTLSYTIDVYRGRFRARRSLIDVATYVTFFPQLVAGPIERAANLIPQLEMPRRLSCDKMWMGLMLILVGYLKKVVLGDGVAPIVDWTYGRAARGEVVSPEEYLLGSVAFTLQLYGDFGGYSDIARGAARLLGIDLMINFRAPYFSRSFRELWTRWHISFSSWLRDYLFQGLGGASKSKLRTLRNLFLTMFLGGLWHGANWTFALWGIMHGVLLVVERAFKFRPERRGYLGQACAVLVVYSLWVSGAPLFRADSIETSWEIFGSFFGPWGGSGAQFLPALVVVLLAGAVTLILDLPHLLHMDEELPCATRTPWLLATVGVAVVGFIVVPSIGHVNFIYFQF